MIRKQRIGFGLFGKRELTSLEGTIISAFFPEAKQMTIKEILERVEYSYERVNSALKSLSEKKLVKEESMGKTLVYSLNLQNLVSEFGFGNYILEKEIEFIKKYPLQYKAIKEIIDNPSILMVVMFGSYSKGTENKQSDIDLLCIPIGNIKKAENFILSLKYKYNFKISPVVISYLEFPEIKKDNPELWSDLKNFGIVFKGDDTFYYWMYKTANNDK